MLAAFLETPLISILLIVLALRLFFPALFGVKRKSTPPPKERTNLRDDSRNKKPDINQQAGKYIDYEEIK